MNRAGVKYLFLGRKVAGRKHLRPRPEDGERVAGALTVARFGGLPASVSQAAVGPHRRWCGPAVYVLRAAQLNETSTTSAR